MKQTITVIKQGKGEVSKDFQDGVQTDLLFFEVQRDTIGKSGSSPTWGHIYSNTDGKLKNTGIALFKGYDYDFPLAAYSEKIWSIFGKRLLNNDIRVPNIDVVEQNPGYEEIISYRLMDNDKEDMIHIKDTLFNKFQREEMKERRNIYTIDELLECVKIQINNEENYKRIEKDMIEVLLLDAITNNGDRHALNWALVRNKKTNEYDLAVFDHASAWINMIENRDYAAKDGWSTSYISVDRGKRRNDIGSNGKAIVEYISKQYPEYFDEFCVKFDKKLPQILEEVKAEDMQIDFNRLVNKTKDKCRYFNKLKDRGEITHE